MKAGLEDVIAGESGICYIDGMKGILAYRGYNIHELATNSTFEETCYLLWFGRLPKQALPMEALRTAVSLLSMYDSEAEDMSPEANLRKAIRLTAQTPTIVTAFHRI